MIIRTPASLDRAALEDNEASEGALGNSFVDVAELVWRKLDGGQTQQAVVDELGMGRESIKNLSSLRKIDAQAWTVIGTSVRGGVPSPGDGGVPASGTDVPFTEGLLRSILSLTPAQQLDLVTRLASKAIQKSQFKTLAEKYRARNEAGGRGSRVYRVWPPPTPSAATRHSRLPARRRSSPTTAPRHPAVASDPLRQHSARPGPGLSCAVVPPRPLAARGTTAGHQR